MKLRSTLLLPISTAILVVAILVAGCAAPAPTPTPAPAKAPAPAPTKAPAAAPTQAPAAAPTKAPAAPTPTIAPAAAKEAPKPAAAAAPAAAKVGDPAKWEQVLAAAKKEGKVVVAGPPGTTYRAAAAVFEARYPEIKLEFQGFTPPQFTSRFAREREANMNLWDVYVTGSTFWDVEQKKAGVFAPLRPQMLLPEVADEKLWFGGFEGAFLDNEKQYVFAFQTEVQAEVHINRDLIKESDLNSIRGIVDPKWKGKIGMYDPRVDGSGNGRFTHWSQFPWGDQFLRALVKQDLKLARDDRQLTEMLVRGETPIAVGIGEAALNEFQKQGVGKNVHELGSKSDEGAWRVATAYGGVRLFAKPVNPNAAIVFANWLLSKEGQTAWVEKANRASRRLDAPKLPTSPDPNVKFVDIDRENALSLREKAKVLANELIK